MTSPPVMECKKITWLNPFKFRLRQGRVQSFVYFRQRLLALAVIFV